MQVNFSKNVSILKMSEAKFSNLFFLDIFLNEILITVMFDTGATMTVLNESTVKLINAEETNINRIAGGSSGHIQECRTVFLQKIRIGNSEIFQQEVLVAPDEALDFGMDEAGNRFMAQGLLGWDIISLFKWTVNRKNETITMEKSIHKDVLQNLSWNKFPLIQATWREKTICFGFDCGHTESILGAKMTEQLEDLHTTVDTTAGVDGTLEEDAYVTKEFNFSIGNTLVSLNNVIVLKRDIFGQGCTDMMGLLGADIIQDRKWILDYPNGYFEIIA